MVGKKITRRSPRHAKPKTVKPVKAILAELGKGMEPLERDPEFVADCLKGQFVEDILRIMEQRGVSRIELAQRLGKSRQYVSRILNETANFTVETMAGIACALGCAIEIRMPSR